MLQYVCDVCKKPIEDGRHSIRLDTHSYDVCTLHFDEIMSYFKNKDCLEDILQKDIFIEHPDVTVNNIDLSHFADVLQYVLDSDIFRNAPDLNFTAVDLEPLTDILNITLNSDIFKDTPSTDFYVPDFNLPKVKGGRKKGSADIIKNTVLNELELGVLSVADIAQKANCSVAYVYKLKKDFETQKSATACPKTTTACPVSYVVDKDKKTFVKQSESREVSLEPVKNPMVKRDVNFAKKVRKLYEDDYSVSDIAAILNAPEENIRNILRIKF